MDSNRSAAEARDAADPLAGFRARFAGTEENGPDRLLYLDGNSLGRMPRETPAALTRVVEQEWAGGLVGSWSAWIGHSTRLGDALAAGVIGARPGEVLVGDSTSVNLYKLLVAAADARPGRDVIVACADDFPTDRYIVAGVAAARGMTVRELPADLDQGLDPAVLAAALDGRVAVVVLSSVAYRSGALADVAAVTQQVHDAGALVLWDLSHGAGARGGGPPRGGAAARAAGARGPPRPGRGGGSPPGRAGAPPPPGGPLKIPPGGPGAPGFSFRGPAPGRWRGPGGWGVGWAGAP